MTRKGLTWIAAAWLLGAMAWSCGSGDAGAGAAAMTVATDSGEADIALTRYSKDYPAISVADTLYDFGTITEGDVVKHNFRFKNTGEKPLVIRNAFSTCGCTVPDYPRKPIAPGEEGLLTVVFNSADKKGVQIKPIYVQANTVPQSITLKITGRVEAKK